MKKILSLGLIIICLLVLPTVISAQGKQQGQETGNGGIEIATQNLNRVTKRTNDPEIGEEIRSMIQNHEQVQTRTNLALQNMSQRNKTIKLLIGPDYKNAGQLRSDIVGLRNDIRKLELIKEKSLPTDIEDIQGAIDELKIEADNLETQLTEQLSGFSLFGWLAKLLTK